MLLDARKAFDMVKHVKLFELLDKRGLCPLFARFLAVFYSCQTTRVKWGDFCSNVFKVSNGVKHGGVFLQFYFQSA